MNKKSKALWALPYVNVKIFKWLSTTSLRISLKSSQSSAGRP